jgi:hypothetical protein
MYVFHQLLNHCGAGAFNCTLDRESARVVVATSANSARASHVRIYQRNNKMVVNTIAVSPLLFMSHNLTCTRMTTAAAVRLLGMVGKWYPF